MCVALPCVLSGLILSHYFHPQQGGIHKVADLFDDKRSKILRLGQGLGQGLGLGLGVGLGLAMDHVVFATLQEAACMHGY